MIKRWRQWLGLLAAFVIPLVPLFVISGDGLRWSGALYQLAGLATVVWGLNERPEAFGLSSLWGNVRLSLSRLRDRLLRRPRMISPAHFSGTLSAGRAEVRGYSDVDIGGSTKQQIDAIKSRLSSITETVVAADKKIHKLEKELAERVEREAAEREKAVGYLRGQAVKAALGNTQLELLGVGLIGLGILLSAWA